jgi:telomerase reverse transcriptase
MQTREKYLKQIKIKESETCLHEELLRYTDDFLFVTSELSRAKEFCRWMHQGNEEYGCFVNFTKSRVNFDAWTEPSSKDGKRHVIPRFDKEEKGHHHKSLPYVSWCGLLIDPTTLQIYVNYEKLNYRVLQSSIPVDNTKALKTVLVTRVLASIRQKWHAMFFSDSWLLPKTIEVKLL